MAKSSEDPQAFSTREQAWTRLDELLRRCERKGLPSLSDKEVDQLGKLYRAAATHLALQREFGASERRRAQLNELVIRGHAFVYGKPPRRRRYGLTRLFLGFPMVVRETWRFHVLAATLLLLGALYGYLGSQADPEWTLELTMGADTRTPYASRADLLETLHHGREGEVSGGEKAGFAAMLWANNTRVAIFALFLGVLWGLPTALLVFYNGAMLGAYTYTFHSRGLALDWWAWILPHGITELGAIVLLAGTGLWIGKQMISPRLATRVDTMRSIGPSVAKMVAIAFPLLFIAALIESYLRQSQLGDTGRYLFALGSLLFWTGYIGFVRVPRRLVRKSLEDRSVAERVVPLPQDQDLLQLYRRA
jgi:uncharacterized membrane protein SpoIIM required for sporulation